MAHAEADSGSESEGKKERRRKKEELPPPVEPAQQPTWELLAFAVAAARAGRGEAGPSTTGTSAAQVRPCPVQPKCSGGTLLKLSSARRSRPQMRCRALTLWRLAQLVAGPRRILWTPAPLDLPPQTRNPRSDRLARGCLP